MIHIVFQYNDIEKLKGAFELDPSFAGEIIQIEDDYSVGPLAGIYSAEGIDSRKQWWRDITAGGDFGGFLDSGKWGDDNAKLATIRDRLANDEKEILWIWAAQNKHDVSGYYWLMSQLKDFQGRVFILYLNNLPFINEKGQLFYPGNLFEIPAREFLKARKLARPITASEFEIDPDEWQKLCQAGEGVRILEGGKKLSHQGYDHYDDELRKLIGGDWVRAHKFIGHFLGKAKQVTGDAYLLWRIKQLAAAGEIDVQGEMKNMRDFEIKARTASPVGDGAISQPE